MLVGAATAVLGDACVMLAPSLNLLLAGRLVDGLGYVLTVVGSITILMRITSGKQRTTGLALWSTSVPVSFILPFLTAGLVIRLGTWRAAFGAHAVVTFLLLLFASTLPKPDVALQQSRTSGLKDVLRSPKPYLLGLSFGSNAFLLSGITASLGPYLARRYGVPELQVQHWSVVAMLLNVAGSLLVGRGLNRGVPALVIGSAGIVLTLISAALLFGVQLGATGSIVAFWVFTFGSGLLVGMWALVPRCSPSPKSLGAPSGLVTPLTLIGVLFGAPLAFAAQAAPSATPMLILVFAVSLLCLVGGAPIWRNVPRTLPSAIPDPSSAIGVK